MKDLIRSCDCIVKIAAYYVATALVYAVYCIAGKFGKFGESSVIHQTKAIQISTYN